MNTKLFGLGLALAAFLTLGVVRSVSAFPGDRLEWLEPERVEAGVDKDEIKVIPGLAGHWGDGYYWQGPPNAGYRSERYADAKGEPVIPPDNVVQSQIAWHYTYPDPEAPNHTRCWEDTPQPAFRSRGYPNTDGNPPGRFDWEVLLESHACQPGYYRMTMAWGGSPTYTFERKFGVELATVLPCTIRVKDQKGVPIQGAVAHTITLGDYTIGPTAVTGLAAKSMPTGRYDAILTAPNCQQKTVVLDHRTDEENGTGAEWLDFTMLRYAEPPTKAGKVEITVVKKGDKTPIAGAQVHMLQQTQNTGDDGKVVLEGLPGSEDVHIHKSGYMGGVVAVQFDTGVTRKYTVKLSELKEDGTGDPPEIDNNSGEDPGFWESLFVPKKETLDELFAKWEVLKAWGPFGVGKQFEDAWHANNVDGEESLVIEFKFDVPFVSNQVQQWDFRPTRTNEEGPYPDGSYGSIQGSMRAHMRFFLGLCVWVVFGIATVKQLQPRFSS